MADNKVVLFVTAGQTDLQLVVQNRETKEICQSQLPKKKVREFHEKLLNGTVKYKIDNGGIEKIQGKERLDICWDEESRNWKSEEPYEIVKEDDSIILFPAKLRQVICKLKEKYQVVGAVVFNTNRNPNAYGKGNEEPIACGKVLAGWLATEFGLSFEESSDFWGGEGISTWIDIMDGDMKLSERGRDYPINREIVRRIEQAMEQFDWESSLRACLSLAGGLPKLKPSIKACADFRFGTERVFYWDEPEFGNVTMFSLGEEIPAPAESFHCRRHALNLLQTGNFPGAYAAAKHLEKDPQEINWVCHLRSAADYFAGRLGEDYELESLKALTSPKNPMCLLAAMRVESALWSGYIPEAINWSCSFLDAAIVDFIERKFGKVNLDKRTVSLKNDPPEKLLKSKGLFKPSGNRYRYDTLGTNRHIWVSHLGNGALEKLRNAMESGNTTPLQFRNRNIHGLLSASQMNEGKKAFGCSGIWSEFPQKTGDYFIGNPMIRPILESLGVSKPGSLYCDLLEEIEKKLLEHKCQ